MIIQTSRSKAQAGINAAVALGSKTEIGLFAGCADVLGVLSRYRQNEEIYGEAEPADSVFKVTRGVVRTYKLLDDGRRHIAAFHFAGDIFGLEPGDDYSQTAEAVVDADVLVFPRRQVMAAASCNVDVARHLWARTAESLSHAEDHMLLLGRKTALERVETFLIEMSGRTAVGGHLDLPMSRRDIADYLGLTLETVSRVLSQLQDEGGLKFAGARSIELRAGRFPGGDRKAAA